MYIYKYICICVYISNFHRRPQRPSNQEINLKCRPSHTRTERPRADPFVQRMCLGQMLAPRSDANKMLMQHGDADKMLL